jgi:hypothetical protein
VGSALSSGDLVVTRDVTTLWDDSAHFNESASGPGCLAVAGAAQQGVYSDSGWAAPSTTRPTTWREPRWPHSCGTGRPA